MQVVELRKWMRENLQTLQEELLECKYKAQAVRGVKIRKSKGGGYRQLGIPTVRDRLVQQATSPQLQKWYEPSFSADSYGFRPKRNASQALRKAAKYVAEGKRKVVDIDLEKFFD